MLFGHNNQIVDNIAGINIWPRHCRVIFPKHQTTAIKKIENNFKTMKIDFAGQFCYSHSTWCPIKDIKATVQYIQIDILKWHF